MECRDGGKWPTRLGRVSAESGSWHFLPLTTHHQFIVTSFINMAETAGDHDLSNEDCFENLIDESSNSVHSEDLFLSHFGQASDRYECDIRSSLHESEVHSSYPLFSMKSRLKARIDSITSEVQDQLQNSLSLSFAISSIRNEGITASDDCLLFNFPGRTQEDSRRFSLSHS